MLKVISGQTAVRGDELLGHQYRFGGGYYVY